MRKYLLWLKVISWLTRMAFRYVSGRPMNGQVYTDSSRFFFRRGTRVLTRDGIVRPWAMRPGWQRAGIRLGCFPGLLGVLVLWLRYPLTTEVAGGLAAIAGTVWLGLRAYHGLRNWNRNRTVIRPLTRALSLVVELEPDEIRGRLVTAEAEVKVPLPDHYAGRPDQVKSVERIVSQRLGGEWDVATNLRNHPFYIHFTPTPAPPRIVPYASIAELVLAAEEHRPVLGLGTRGEPILLNFKGEIAHLGVSIGTQGGKSSFARYLVGHFGRHGCQQLMCDVKQVSIQGMEDTPGLTICRHPESIWDALAAARREMDRRYSVLAKNPSRTFPRMVIYLEEQNAFAVLTANRWREVKEKKDPALAPVWGDIALLLVMAAQVNINLVGFYQRMGAAECGGGSFRDQFGMKLLGRFSPAAWDSLVGERPRGKSENDIQGRAIAIMGSSRRTVQLPWVTIPEAMGLATSGGVTVTAPETHEVSVSSPVTVTPTFTMAEAARQSWCEPAYDALKQRKHRGRLHLPAGTDRWTEAEWLAALTDSVHGGDSR